MTGVTYVVVHPWLQSVKVGFTSPSATRLRDLSSRGWSLYRTLDSKTPELAREIEQATLFDIRFRLYVPAHLTEPQMFGLAGWTETSSLALISAREVWDLLCEQAAIVQLAPVVSGPPDGRRNNGGTPPRRLRGDTLPYSRMARTQARLERTVPGAKNFRPSDN
jgi:hypothetical protein